MLWGSQWCNYESKRKSFCEVAGSNLHTCAAFNSQGIKLQLWGLGKTAILYSECCWRPSEDEKCMSVVKNPSSLRGTEAMNHKKEINQCSCEREREVSSLFSPALPLKKIISEMIYFLINVQWQVWSNWANNVCQLEGPKGGFALTMINLCTKAKKLSNTCIWQNTDISFYGIPFCH